MKKAALLGGSLFKFAVAAGLLLFWLLSRRCRASGESATWNRRLSGRLILLQLQLALLHFLEHLLWSLDSGCIRRRSLLLLGFRGGILIRVVVGIFLGCIRSVRCVLYLLLWRRSHVALRLTRLRRLWLSRGGGYIFGSALGDQHYAGQSARIFGRTQQYVIEARSIQ